MMAASPVALILPDKLLMIHRIITCIINKQIINL